MTPYADDGDMRLYVGDCLDVLRQLPDESVDCCVTSPPYWGLRDYGTGEWDGGKPDCDHPTNAPREPSTARTQKPGWDRSSGKVKESAIDYSLDRTIPGRVCVCGARRVDRQLGLEPTPDAYVQNMVAVFREVRRVLAPHGTCWVNLGDTYHGGGGGNYGVGLSSKQGGQHLTNVRNRIDLPGLKPKDLVGIPWRVAFALQADGWWLRSDIIEEVEFYCPCGCGHVMEERVWRWSQDRDLIWKKPNPMPESVTDRPTKAHEYLFLLAKQPRYWFDAEAVREPGITGDMRRPYTSNGAKQMDGRPSEQWRGGELRDNPAAGRNVRSVWEIPTQPFPGAHFATFPEELARRCIVAGCASEVCRVCGKPRERIVATSYENPGNRTTNGDRSLERRHETAGFPVRLEKRTSTEGWSDCGHNNYRPGVVLDPFAGAGTVGLVARKHARHSVLIELSEQYAREILLPRLSQLSLLAEVSSG